MVYWNNMKVNPDIFRAYDVRGIYPDQLEEKTAYFIGRSFAEFLEKPSPRVVLARDSRSSGQSLKESLIKGLLDGGAEITDSGLACTPLFYFSVAGFGFDGGINITASHNPKEYNGFKMVKKGAVPLSGGEGLKKIREKMESESFREKKKGGLSEKSFLEDYVRFNLRGFEKEKMAPLVLAADTANAVPGIFLREIFKNIPCKLHHIFKEVKGDFPNHSPNPLDENNLDSLKKEVLKRKASLGAAFDGDGDRIVFIDEEGKQIPAHFIIALMASLLLEENPGSKILYDVRSSRIVEETVEKEGGVSIVNRVGHPFIKERMKKENVLFAGEYSGHYYYREHYFCEAPFFVLLKVMEKLAESGKSFSRLIEPYKKYFHSGEINFKVKDKERVLEKLEDKYKDGKVSKVDGLRVDFSDWWFSARASNTEPFLRLVVEAETEKIMEEKKKELEKFISSPWVI